MIHFVRPKLVSIDEDQCVIRIRLCRRSKNHLNSMYFGALAVGADIAAGIQAYYFSDLEKKKISLAFKSMSVDFLKRAETDIFFKSSQGNEILQMIHNSFNQSVRVNQLIEVHAENSLGEIVAIFKMELSLKVI
jgi:hypothetical protein